MGLVTPWLMAEPKRYALMHGDYRLDNMLFDPDRTRITVVDWQTMGVGLPGRDLAYFTATSLVPEVRSEIEQDLHRDADVDRAALEVEAVERLAAAPAHRQPERTRVGRVAVALHAIRLTAGGAANDPRMQEARRGRREARPLDMRPVGDPSRSHPLREHDVAGRIAFGGVRPATVERDRQRRPPRRAARSPRQAPSRAAGPAWRSTAHLPDAGAATGVAHAHAEGHRGSGPLEPVAQRPAARR